VACGRHLRPWSSLGCEVAEGPGGLAVAAVQPGRFAHQAGARTGDLVLTVAGAPVVTVRELAVLLRSLRSGTDAKLRYLREGRVLAGSGTL
jgi:S1-C subfamily serine protease